MAPQIYAYVRVSTPSQSRESLKQVEHITAAFPGHEIISETEVSNGSIPIASRPGFRRILNKSKTSGSPVILTHPDRLQKSLNSSVIIENRNFLSRSGIELRFLHDNTEFHQHMESLLWRSGAARSSHLTRVFVRIISQQTEHRQRLLSNSSATVKPARKYASIKKQPYYREFRKIAKLIISKADQPRILRRFMWDAYFGSAYDCRYIKHGAVSGHGRRVGTGPSSLMTLPQDHRVAQAVFRLEQLTTTFADGRPRPLSNAEIAHRLNTQGLRNRLGNRFSREGVFHFRRHPAYLAFKQTAGAAS